MKTWRDGWMNTLSASSTNMNQDICSPRIREIVDRGTTYPATLNVSEVHELCGSIANYYLNSQKPLFCSTTLFKGSVDDR